MLTKNKAIVLASAKIKSQKTSVGFSNFYINDLS